MSDTVDCLPVSRFVRDLGLAGLGSFAEIVDIAGWEQSLFHPLGLEPYWRKRGRAIPALDSEWDLLSRGSDRWYWNCCRYRGNLRDLDHVLSLGLVRVHDLLTGRLGQTVHRLF